MKKLGILIAAVLTCGGLAASVPAAAQDPPAAQTAADRLVERAVQLRDATVEPEAAGTEAISRGRRLVRSPYFRSDTTGDTLTRKGDVRAIEVRNFGRRSADLRFFNVTRPTGWNSGTTAAIWPVDSYRNGKGFDYDVVLVSTRQTGFGVVILPRNSDTPTCVNFNVRQIPQNGYRLWFRKTCVGDPRTFATRLLFVYAGYDGDAVPNRTFTPWITPQ